MKTGISIVCLLWVVLACQPQEEQVKWTAVPDAVQQVAARPDDIITCGGSYVMQADKLQAYQEIFDSLHLAYNASLPVSRIPHFTNLHEYQQAIITGMHSADLFYAYLCKHPGRILSHLRTTYNGFNILQASQYLNLDSLRTSFLERSVENKWDLLTGTGLENMYQFFRTQHREEFPALMYAGLIVEQTYLLCELYREHRHKLLKDRIGLQKFLYSDLELILRIFKEECLSIPHTKMLYETCKELEKVYLQVDIKQYIGKSILVEENGELVIKSTTKTIVDISPQQIRRITVLITQLRNSLISNNQ